MGKVATSPLPPRGSPPLQSGGQNQKWPTCGQGGYVTPAVSGIPTASKRGAKSEVAHLWAKWLRHRGSLGDPHRFKAGGQNQKWPTCGQSGYVTPAVSGIPTALELGGKIRSGPLVGKVATSPLPSRGSPPPQSGGQNQKWPTCGQSGYVTPAASGIPTASDRGAKTEVAHLCAKWLRHRGRLGDPHRYRAGGKIRSGPLVRKVATSPLPSRGSPPLQSGGQNQKWPTCGQGGYVTPAVSGIPTATERRAKSEVAHLWAKWLRNPCRLGDPLRFNAGGQNQKWPTCGQGGYVTTAASGIPSATERGAISEVAHLCANGLRHPCRLGDPQRFRAGGKITNGPLVGKVATSPLPSRGSPPPQSGRGAKSEVAHLWAKWLRHPCRLGDPHRFRAGGKIRSGPLVGKVATSPLPSRGSPPLQSGGQNQKWPTCGQSGYVTPAVSGIPSALERGAKSEVAHLWARWLRHPCHLGDPLRLRAGGGQNQKWPTCGQSGYVTLAASGIPTASERGAKSEVAHLWARWLRHPCRLGDPHRFKAGGKIRSGPLVGKVATSPRKSRGSPPLQSGGAKSEVAHLWAKWLRHPCRLGDPHRFRAGGQNQKWPTCGQSGYVTPAVSGIPSASEWGAKSEVAHLWAKWLRHPCRLGDPHRFRPGGKNRSGPLVRKVATSPRKSRGSPPLQSGGQNQKWPTCAQSGYVTPAVSGIPTASKRGAKSEVAHLWARWLRHPCRLGDPHRYRAEGKIRSGPLVGKVAT